MIAPPELYKKHFIDKHDERLGLFTLMSNHYPIQSVLYPGSFVHVTPAFVFPISCFIDTDRRAARFFGEPTVLDYVCNRKTYDVLPTIRFHHMDYSKRFDEVEGSFDLLLSQYAGFISQECKRYLKINGVLLANNSHGDASMASIDPDYKLNGIVTRRGEQFKHSTNDLESYFLPKKNLEIDKEYLRKHGRGIGYTRSAFSYIFQRVA